MTSDESFLVYRVEPYTLNPDTHPQDSSLGNLLQDLESGRSFQRGQNAPIPSSPGPENMTSGDGLDGVESQG